MPDLPRASPQAFVLAPVGRDASIIVQLLTDAGIASKPQCSLPDLVAALSYETSFAVIADEELLSADLRDLSRWISAQPSWSDLPIIVLTRHADHERSEYEGDYPVDKPRMSQQSAPQAERGNPWQPYSKL